MSAPKLKFPRTVLVAGREWGVDQVQDLKWHKQPMQGLCHRDSRHIEIEKNQNLVEKTETFAHEWLHACEREFGFTMQHRAIERMERMLADLWLNNPGLLRALLKAALLYTSGHR